MLTLMDPPFPWRRRAVLTLPVLLAGLAGGRVGGAAPRQLRLVSDPSPPYVMPAGHRLGEGIDVDIARTALALAGFNAVELELVPWRRALAMLASGAADLAPAVRRTPEREKFVVFSQPYGEPVQHRFLTPTGSGLHVRHLRDLRGMRIGLVRGFAYPAPLREILGEPAAWATHKEALLRMAAARHIDVAVVNAVTADWLLSQLQLTRALDIQPYAYTSGERTQFALSRRSPAALAALEPLNAGLRQLEREGWGRFAARYVGDA